jgi:serine/threonine-protein kinase RsbT
VAPEKLGAASYPITAMIDVIVARRQGREMALALGFPLTDATKIAVVISELARNILLYAKTGMITLVPCQGVRVGIRIVAEDKGPGIADVQLVLAGGYSTSKGLGVGISGSKKLVDEFEIHSTVGVGTTVRATKWIR